MGFAASYGIPELDPAGMLVFGLIIGGLIGFAVGWQVGQDQAFKLRLRAQEVLCRMMIEKNTADLVRLAARPSTGSGAPDDATLQSLRPGRSLKVRMGRLGQ